jgi:hypothetical protein
MFTVFRDFDAFYRANLGANGTGYLLSDAINDSSSFVAFSASSHVGRKRGPSPVHGGGGSGGSTSSSLNRVKEDYSEGVCQLFNQGKEHPEAAYAKKHPPRKHVCDTCFQRVHRWGDDAYSGRGPAGAGGGVPVEGVLTFSLLIFSACLCTAPPLLPMCLSSVFFLS